MTLKNIKNVLKSIFFFGFLKTLIIVLAKDCHNIWWVPFFPGYKHLMVVYPRFRFNKVLTIISPLKRIHLWTFINQFVMVAKGAWDPKPSGKVPRKSFK